MLEPVHGKFSVYRQGNTVYCDYSYGFNAAGVKAITEEILSVAKPLKQWVLLQRPEPSAGITYDAIELMYQCYVSLQRAGCLAVGLHENSIFVHSGRFRKDGELTMPITINKDIPTLVDFLNQTLEKHNIR
jgi:hypothetical protein